MSACPQFPGKYEGTTTVMKNVFKENASDRIYRNIQLLLRDSLRTTNK